MRLSHFFMHTSKEDPKEAQVESHRLMLRANLIHQNQSGIYSWLPLGVRVLQKIERIVEEEQSKVNAQRIIMPTIQSATLWRESGRYEAYGKEMLRFKDRHDRDLLYGPTHEEVVVDLFRHYVKSYKHLPLNLYQIHWKFRDEIRPRFGVMRGREFLMKDGYSFHTTREDALREFAVQFKVYLKIFKRMGLKTIPVRADCGPIGGDNSYEFQVLATTGESELFYDARLDTLDLTELSMDEVISFSAYTDEYKATHSQETSPHPMTVGRGIEVGHIFLIEKKYTNAMNVSVLGEDSRPLTPYMATFGMGISRLVAALIEAFHDEWGIKWPVSVAPFEVVIINLKMDDATICEKCETLYKALNEAGIDVLYDDRFERAGAKFFDMDLIGIPYQVCVGAKSLQSPTLEVKRRQTQEKIALSLEELICRIQHEKINP